MADDVEEWLGSRKRWQPELAAVREVFLGAGLAEQLKWRKACYTHGDHNIVILQPMKAHLALMFFKGALLADPKGLLHDQGPNSRSAKRVEIHDVAEVKAATKAIRALVREAVAAAEAGLEVEPTGGPQIPDELAARFGREPKLAAAFAELTPGRQRHYCMHIGGAKKTETRQRRVDQCAPRILAGKGLRD